MLEHVNWIDGDDRPDEWPVPPGFRELRMKDSVDGLLMTAMHSINAVPLVVAAPPGVVDQAHLPPFGSAHD